MTRNIHNVSTTPAEAGDNRLIEKEVYRSSRIRAGEGEREMDVCCEKGCFYHVVF